MAKLPYPTCSIDQVQNDDDGDDRKLNALYLPVCAVAHVRVIAASTQLAANPFRAVASHRQLFSRRLFL
jgi:hypothetical protein